jgi:hypothetical protein
MTSETAPLTLGDVLAEFGAIWQVHAAQFCYVAVRRPTATSQEIVVGQSLDQLVEKLRAERDQDDHRGS